MRYDAYHHIDADDVYLGTTPADPFEFRASAKPPAGWDEQAQGLWEPPPPNPALQDDWMPPPYKAVWADLPPVHANEALKLVDGAFAVIPDWRGHVYWTADGTKQVITKAGVVPPADALDAAPPPALSTLKAAKAAKLDADCAAQIVGGFESSALGAVHTYPSKATDQANLTASVLDAMLNADNPAWVTPFWCADAGGVWAWRNHTAEQIKHVGRDGKAAVITAQTRNAALQAAVAAATTVAELETIAW